MKNNNLPAWQAPESADYRPPELDHPAAGNSKKPLTNSVQLRPLLPFVLAAVLGGAFQPTRAAQPVAKNVVLFLGDGTGLPTIHAASIYAHGRPQALYVHRMAHIGLMETSSASNWVTDSAAGMTAIVTGEKTNNGVVSQAADSERGARDGRILKTILEYAEERGLSTGVVTNSPVADATPAACYAHNNDRSEWVRSFMQILKPRFGDGLEVAIGRGRERLLRETAEIGVDLRAGFEKRGYRFLEGVDGWQESARGVDRLIVLFESPTAYDILLEQAALQALDILGRNPKGFFLMIECDNHLKDVRESVEQMAKLDRLVERTANVLRGTDTLIVVATDHSYDLHFPSGTPIGEDIIPALKAAGHHNAEEVLVTAEGPGAERVSGFFANTKLFHIMMAAYGWE